MGAKDKLKDVLKAEGISQKKFAEIVMPEPQYKDGYTQLRNAIARDTFSYNTLEKWLDELGYEIVFKKKENTRGASPRKIAPK